MASNKTYGGMFNFSQIMDDFYSSSPDNDEGRMQKNAFQGNFIQTGLDAQVSQQLGQFNAGLAQSNMTHAADLELRNQSALMKDEFNYGMQAMDAQFGYKNEFADAQHGRDLGMVGAMGEQDRLNMDNQGQQDRLTTITTGEQTRLTDDMNNVSKEKMASGSYDKDRDVANTEASAQIGSQQIAADASRDTAKTTADATKDVAGIQSDAEKYKADSTVKATQIGADADKFKATTAADASKYGSDRTVDVANVNAKGTIDNTRATGDETRKTQDNENRLKAKDRANMHSYARSTARAF